MIDRRKTVILVLLLLCTTAACTAGAREEVPLPAGLIGRWATDAPQYADRYFDLSADTLVIGTGPATSETYDVTRVWREVNDDGVLYTVEYSDDAGEEYDIGFYFDTAAGSELRMRNQPNVVWRKVP